MWPSAWGKISIHLCWGKRERERGRERERANTSQECIQISQLLTHSWHQFILPSEIWERMNISIILAPGEPESLINSTVLRKITMIWKCNWWVMIVVEYFSIQPSHNSPPAVKAAFKSINPTTPYTSWLPGSDWVVILYTFPLCWSQLSLFLNSGLIFRKVTSLSLPQPSNEFICSYQITPILTITRYMGMYKVETLHTGVLSFFLASCRRFSNDCLRHMGLSCTSGSDGMSSVITIHRDEDITSSRCHWNLFSRCRGIL